MAKAKKKKQVQKKKRIALNPKGLLKSVKTHNDHLREAFNMSNPPKKKKYECLISYN